MDSVRQTRRVCPRPSWFAQTPVECRGSAGHSGLWALDIEEGSHKDPGGRRWDVDVQNASEAIAATIEAREEKEGQPSGAEGRKKKSKPMR